MSPRLYFVTAWPECCRHCEKNSCPAAAAASTTTMPAALSSGLESVGECCAAAQLRRNHLLPVTRSHVRGRGADGGMQLLRFALVQRRHARLNENSALPRNRLDDLEA
jgi:hypothetical protein